ncbi:MAG: Nif3-like dinuclear metal center hexameric protein [Oscillospiraceae bacterium]
MTKVRDIVNYFAQLVPPEMKMDFDNVGLLVGLNECEVKRALVALDITDDVIDEAIGQNAQIILSHHPLFFDLKQVNDDDCVGRKIALLLRNGVSALCQHTNLDSVDGGVNDALARALKVTVEGRLEEHITSIGVPYGCGRYGHLQKPMPLGEFLAFAKSALKTNGIRYCDAGRVVHKIALCGGSGGEYIETAAALGCDTIVTADLKYHQLLLAKELRLNALDADHFCTENFVVPVLAEMLKVGFPDVEVRISEVHGQTARFF